MTWRIYISSASAGIRPSNCPSVTTPDDGLTGKADHRTLGRVRTVAGPGSERWELDNSRVLSLIPGGSWGSCLCTLPVCASMTTYPLSPPLTTHRLVLLTSFPLIVSGDSSSSLVCLFIVHSTTCPPLKHLTAVTSVTSLVEARIR